MAEAPPGALEHGVVTASAGNMAQGVAWGARERGIPCTVVVPDTAPQTKLDAIERLGGAHPAGAVRGVVARDRDVASTRGRGLFRPSRARRRRDGRQRHDRSRDPRGPARRRRGARAMGRRRAACGIASALKQQRPGVRVIACEPETGAPLTASLPAGESQAVDYSASFVDGSGSRALLPKMWGLAQELMDGAVAVSPRRRPRPRFGCSPSARASSPKAPGALSLAAARAGARRQRQGRLHRLRRQHRRSRLARSWPARRRPDRAYHRVSAGLRLIKRGRS